MFRLFLFLLASIAFVAGAVLTGSGDARGVCGIPVAVAAPTTAGGSTDGSVGGSAGTSSSASSAVAAAEGLLARRFPEWKDKVRFEVIAPAENNADVFELQTRDGKLLVRGNNGVSLASGFNWYLKHYCNCQITFRSQQVKLPVTLPEIALPARVVSPHKYRYYFNYCAFSYTLAFWHWNDWERMIDFLALYGVNAPLSVTGSEGVWRNVGRRLGLSDAQMQEFFVGPAFLPFGWMGCIDKWAGPLPNAWIDEHVALQKKILERERAFGMTPILQGFTGHAPKALENVRKDAKLVKLTPWCGFPSTYFIDPATPFFQEVGRIWVEEQTKLFGTDHLYASDTFIEMRPPSSDPSVLRKMGEAIYGGMRAADADAIWVLQGWFLVSDPKFWQKPQRDAFFKSVPQGKLLVIDLSCEYMPVWSRSEAFSGQPWIWSIISNFGGEVCLFGGIDIMAADLKKALARRGNESGNLSGVGFTMEGIDYNPLIDEWQSDMVWRGEVPDAKDWIQKFVRRRYGKENADARAAWEILHRTAYLKTRSFDTVLNSRPRLGNIISYGACHRKTDTKLPPALRSLLSAENELAGESSYQFDIIMLVREILGSIAGSTAKEMETAFRNNDRAALKTAANKIQNLCRDIDRILACNENFLLGRWLEDAKRWARSDWERKHYEWNARTLISLWGPAYSHYTGLDDYAAKQWSGMFRDYYARRWDLFYRELDKSLAEKRKWDGRAFDKKIVELELAWAKETTLFPTQPSGENPITIAKELLSKYESDFAGGAKIVKSLTTHKPVKCTDFLNGMNPENANDGIVDDSNSFWGCDVAKSASKSAWWQVDFGKPETVGKVVVVCYYGDKRPRYYGFCVEGSLDGKNWTMLADRRRNTAPATPAGYTCEFPPQKMRHLRVTQTHNSANTGRHLVEVLAF
jgi:alpha-N-acetylglucosaminidase